MYRFQDEKSRGRVDWAMMELFNDWIRGHGLDDVQISNRSFTWPNKRDNPTLVRLDRALVNAHWLLAFAQSSASVVPSVTSDHVPFLVVFDNLRHKSQFFRMENHWLKWKTPRRSSLMVGGVALGASFLLPLCSTSK